MVSYWCGVVTMVYGVITMHPYCTGVVWLLCLWCDHHASLLYWCGVVTMVYGCLYYCSLDVGVVTMMVKYAGYYCLSSCTVEPVYNGHPWATIRWLL